MSLESEPEVRRRICKVVAALTLAVEGLQWKSLVWQPIGLVETVWKVLYHHVLAEMRGLGVGGSFLQH